MQFLDMSASSSVIKTGEPTYLTKKWLENVISRYESTAVIVKSFSVERGCSETDGFLSALHACSVTAEWTSGREQGEPNHERKYELMLKSLAADPDMRKFMLESGWHRQEVVFYSKVVPVLQKFVDETAAVPYRYLNFLSRLNGSETPVRLNSHRKDPLSVSVFMP